NKGGNGSTQVQQRVQLHRSLGRAKVGPWEQRQAQVDCRGVQRVDGVVQFQAQRVGGIKFASSVDQPLGEVGVDPPIALLVGIGQSSSSDALAQSHVIKLCGLCRQAAFYVSQTLSIRKLRERHHAELLGAGKGAYPAIAAIPLNDSIEGAPRQKVHDLREQRLAYIHREVSGTGTREGRRRADSRSSR